MAPDGPSAVISGNGLSKCHALLQGRPLDRFRRSVDAETGLADLVDVDLETQNLDIIIPLLLYLVWSISFEDKFIDALNNGLWFGS